MLQEIQKDRVLNVGDRVLMTYSTPGATWIKATEAAMVENRLEGVKGFKIVSVDYLKPGLTIFEIEVIPTNPIIVTVAYISGAILGATAIFLAAGWMFQKAELVVKTPAAKMISGSMLIFALIAVYTIFKNKGRIA